MSVTLRQTLATTRRIDLRQIRPDLLLGMSTDDIARLPLYEGNRQRPLSDLFDVETQLDGEATLELRPANDRLDYIGAGATHGRIVVRGNAGHHTGQGMSGGSIEISGNSGDHAGGGMQAGRLLVHGNAGDFLGGPATGERSGQRGGLIHVRGNAGDRAGERMRRGTVVIEGDCGAMLGHRMISGTLYVGGKTGELPGYGMRRGTLLLSKLPGALGSTFGANGPQVLPFLRLLLKEIQQTTGLDTHYLSHPKTIQRFVGDLARDGRGEILVLD